MQINNQAIESRARVITLLAGPEIILGLLYIVFQRLA